MRSNQDNCLRCGQCCRVLIIEIEQADIDREKSLKKYATPFGDNGTYMLQTPCPFLQNNMCSIYETRPDVCRDFKPMCDKCITI
jgi:uncharacterized protein